MNSFHRGNCDVPLEFAHVTPVTKRLILISAYWTILLRLDVGLLINVKKLKCLIILFINIYLRTILIFVDIAPLIAVNITYKCIISIIV